MASILNNTARKYSLAYGSDPEKRITHCLKVLPGHLTWSELQRQQKGKEKLNLHVSTEKDFEDIIEKLLKVDYVRVLCDLGRLTINDSRNTHLEEAEEKPKPKRKPRKTKKKVEADLKGPFE